MSADTRKKAILFDVDDTLYDQTVPFKEAYREYFGADPAVPADVIYPVTRKYSDQVYSRAMAGQITMEDMYIYRVQKAFEEFRRSMQTVSGISICRSRWRRFLIIVKGKWSWGSSRTVLQSISGIR